MTWLLNATSTYKTFLCPRDETRGREGGRREEELCYCSKDVVLIWSCNQTTIDPFELAENESENEKNEREKGGTNPIHNGYQMAALTLPSPGPSFPYLILFSRIYLLFPGGTGFPPLYPFFWLPFSSFAITLKLLLLSVCCQSFSLFIPSRTLLLTVSPFGVSSYYASQQPFQKNRQMPFASEFLHECPQITAGRRGRKKKRERKAEEGEEGWGLDLSISHMALVSIKGEGECM